MRRDVRFFTWTTKTHHENMMQPINVVAVEREKTTQTRREKEEEEEESEQQQQQVIENKEKERKNAQFKTTILQWNKRSKHVIQMNGKHQAQWYGRA